MAGHHQALEALHKLRWQQQQGSREGWERGRWDAGKSCRSIDAIAASLTAEVPSPPPPPTHPPTRLAPPTHRAELPRSAGQRHLERKRAIGVQLHRHRQAQAQRALVESVLHACRGRQGEQAGDEGMWTEKQQRRKSTQIGGPPPPPAHMRRACGRTGARSAPNEKPLQSPAPSSVAAAPRNLALKRPSSRSTQPCQACSTSRCSSRLSCEAKAMDGRKVG